MVACKLQSSVVVVINVRVGLAIWGLQSRAKGPEYFFKKGYFVPKTGLQKPDVKEFFDVEEHFKVKKDG